MPKRDEGGKPIHTGKLGGADKTNLTNRGLPPVPDDPTDIVDGKTKLVRGTSDNARKVGVKSIERKSTGDPVVGWLVVKNGPLKGRSFDVGYGNNTIGRSESSKICLANSDITISRSKHCILTYDPKGRAFYLRSGDGRNLTYLNDKPVLDAVEIGSYAEISIGRTALMFVALCGPDFDWQDLDG